MTPLHRMNKSTGPMLAMMRRVLRRLRGVNERVVTLNPPASGAPKGRVLLSYIIDGVLAPTEAKLPHSHPHFWETRAMAEAFRDEGYIVDVVHWTRRNPPPRTDYDVYVDVRRNFDQFSKLMPESCFKIAHMDTAHHRVHNGNQMKRLEELRQRSGIDLKPFKLVEQNSAAEQADLIVVLGNEFTLNTFAYAGKPIRRIRLSNAFAYPFPESKDFSKVRRRYLWMGSEGFVHKGLDLVLEAFAGMPETHLTVCGPLNREPAFTRAFHQLLFNTPNIHTEGWVDVHGGRFRDIAGSCLGGVYPSCSEGGGGCVITMMHAGLIPVVSREASVDIEPGRGVMLSECSVESIQSSIKDMSAGSPARLSGMAHSAWSWVRTHHSRERFRAEYRALVQDIPGMRST